MQRLIKFRGKRVDTKQWIFGDLLTFNGDRFEIADWNDITCSRFDVIPESVGQFTGRQDMHGNDIYEHDVLQDSDGNLQHVVFWNGTWWLQRGYTMINPLAGEHRYQIIVGNFKDE